MPALWRSRAPDYLQKVEEAWAHVPPTTVGLTGPALFGTNCSFRAEWWRFVRGGLDLADTDVHDDIQLSFMVQPGETVRYVADLVVGMDGRALRGRQQIRRRVRNGWYSMMRGFAASPPWRRLPQRWRATRGGFEL